MKPLAPNTMIQNRYLVVHLIGKGGMGEVYLAVDQRLGSAVALKRTSFAEDQMLAAAFEREAKILARLRHPVLPKVSDHFTENGEQYLVMEHISGDDLSKRLESAGKPFPVSWVMFWADQLLDALSYLHSHEPPIIHRDIKPQNLKLTDDNHIVLLDFGLSKDTSVGTAPSKPGSSGSVVGYTPHFAPMEQIRGTGTNPRSDIYSLSATLYQLMTDVVPVDALSRADSLISNLPDPIKALSELNPEISPAVSNVILKGLEVSQDKRFSSASEMQKALRSAYAQIQGEMSAETVAFNVADHIGADVHSTSPPIDRGRSVAPSEMATITPAVPFLSTQPEVGADHAVEVKAEEHPVSMENTIRMDPPVLAVESPVAEAPVMQADVKTEIFLGSDIAFAAPSVPEPAVQESPPAPVMERPAAMTEDFGHHASEPVDPMATVPLVDIGEAATPPSPPSPLSEEPAVPAFFETAAIETPAAKQVAEPQYAAEPTAAPKQQAPPPQKAKSRAGLLLGALAAIFVLALVAAAGGYFAYTKYFAGTAVKPTPTPTAAPSPSPSPTVEPTPANSNSTSGNTDIVVPPTPEPSKEDVPTIKQAPDVDTVRPPSKGKPTPGAKSTPKKSSSSDRTVILQ